MPCQVTRSRDNIITLYKRCVGEDTNDDTSKITRLRYVTFIKAYKPEIFNGTVI